MADHGYDVAIPRDIDPLFGGIPGVRTVGRCGAPAGHQSHRVVPNPPVQRTHGFRPRWLTSGSPAPRIAGFRDRRGPDGSLPPTAGVPCSAGPAWTQCANRTWQPSQVPAPFRRTWDNPEILDDFEKAYYASGWTAAELAHRRGARHGQNPRRRTHQTWASGAAPRDDDPTNHPENVHAIHRDIRTLTSTQAVTVGEVWVHDSTRWAGICGRRTASRLQFPAGANRGPAPPSPTTRTPGRRGAS